jgi:hypothetical protein
LPQNEPHYLDPYLAAAREHGAGFETLLWASPATQAARFEIVSAAVQLRGRSLLDVGAGRGDLHDYLRLNHNAPAEYLGIEALEVLADAATARGHRIIRDDFIANPTCLFTGSDVVVICGSINTCADEHFFKTLRRAFDAAARCLVFNFLSSPVLAGASHLHWREPAAVELFCREMLGAQPVKHLDYFDGDATFVLTKP